MLRYSGLALLLLAACSRTDGDPLDPSALDHRACLINDDCLPHGYCSPQGLCASQCRWDDDCALFGEGLGCYGSQCLSHPPFPADDGGLPDGPEAVCGETDRACEAWGPEECEAHGWVPFCSDGDCVGLGWGHGCQGGLCVDRCLVELGAEGGLYGVWGMVLATAVRSTNVPLVSHQDSVIVHHGLSRISLQGGQAMIHTKVCRIGFRNFDDSQVYDECEPLGGMVIPQAYADSVTLLEHSLSPMSLEAGASFLTSSFLELRGVVLDDPWGDPLPTTGEAPGVWDQDGDGKPGLTIMGCGLLSGYEAYMLQRLSTALRGEVIDQDRLAGPLDLALEQSQLGSNMDMPAPVTMIHPEGDRSYFRMMRMAEESDCEDVVAEADREGSWIAFTGRLGDR